MISLAKRLGDITTDDLLFFVIVFICASFVLSIILMIWKRKLDKENYVKPIMGGEAVIVDMQQLAPNMITPIMWILFEDKDGKRIRVTCKPNNDYVIGDRGYLKWQGTRMISFARGAVHDSKGNMSVVHETESWLCVSCGYSNQNKVRNCQNCGVSKQWSDNQRRQN